MKNSILFILCAFITSLSYGDELPDIGNPADSKLSLYEERLIGQELYRNLLKRSLIINDPESINYLRHIGNSLVNQLDDAEQNYTFFLVKDRNINAFAAPGAYIGINTGLIAASKSEDEVASVLAHEIAHVNQRHIARRLLDIESSQALSFATILAGFLAASQGHAQAGSALLYGGIAAQQQQVINFTRANEIEADRIGINLLSRADYNPEGMISFFKTMQQQSGRSNLDNYQHLLTHPLDRNRIAEAEHRIAQLNQDKRRNKDNNLDYQFIQTRINAFNTKDKATLLQRSQRLLDDSVLSQYRLAQAYEANRQWQNAISIYQQLVTTGNEMPFILGLSRCYLKTNRYADAIRILEPHLRIQPDHYAVNIYYAEALLKQQQAADATTVINDYLRRYQPLTPEIFQILSTAYAANQETYMAKKTQVEYLVQNGNYGAAIGLLRNLLKDESITSDQKNTLQTRLQEIDKLHKKVKNLG